MPDQFDLRRFVDAQEEDYDRALREIREGRKQSHWMWYVFPQFAGLGMSATSQHYAIGSLAEASAYLAHPVLGPRLLECANAVLALRDRSALEVFGSPDDLKLRSSATLFAAVSPAGSPFHRIVEQYFGGDFDGRTRALIAMSSG